jgi:hypothetical protein
LLSDNDSNNDLCDRWIIHNLFWTVLTKHCVYDYLHRDMPSWETKRFRCTNTTAAFRLL